VKKPPSPVWTVEVTPVEDTNPTKTQHTFIATVFDREGRPLPNVQVHWILARTGDAVGDIVTYDDQDLGVGMARALTRKTDNYYAVSYTNEDPVVLHAGMRWKPDPADRKNFQVLPGQTWCTITSPVEGDSHMIVYVPAIEDARCHKVFAVKHWRPQPSLAITKNCPAEVQLGETFEYEITVMNNGDGTAHNVWVMEQLPEGIEIVDGTTFPYDLGDLGPGESSPPIRFQVRTTAAPVHQGGFGVNIAMNCGGTYGLGQTVPFDVTVTNPNAEPIQSVTVTARVDGGVSSISSADGSVSGMQVIWNVGMIGPGESFTRSFTGVATDPGTGTPTHTAYAEVAGQVTTGVATEFLNRVEARDNQGQGEFYARAECLTRGSASSTTPVAASDQCSFQTVGEPKLYIEKTGPAQTHCGGEVTWRITVGNSGTAPFENVTVEDVIPQGFRLTSGQTRWDTMLAPGESKTFDVTAVATTRGQAFTNTATARGAGQQVSSSATISVVGTTLSVTKDCTGTSPDQKMGRATITVRNDGSVPAYGIRVNDTLPAGMRATGASDGGRAGGGTVVWDNIGDLGPGESKTVTFDYQITGLGRIVNRVAVADMYNCASAADECVILVFGPPGAQAEVVDGVAGNLDADAFPVSSEFYYRAIIQNEGSLPLMINFNITLSSELERAGTVGETDANGTRIPSAPFGSGQTVDGVTYEFSFRLEPGSRKAIRVPVRALQATPTRAARMGLQIRWDALNPETGARMEYHGEFEVQETTWITGG
jgi:uncharacterized repeat protein (TIGR01451 family)